MGCDDNDGRCDGDGRRCDGNGGRMWVERWDANEAIGVNSGQDRSRQRWLTAMVDRDNSGQ